MVSALKAESIRVGVVSVFPPRGVKHAGFGGVASYTKNLVTSYSGMCQVVIFADSFSRDGDVYRENGVWVFRCWSRGLLYPFQIFRNVARRRNDVDVLHVQHEYFLFGGVFSAVLFPFLLFLLRLFRKPVVVTLHGVISLSVIDWEFLRDNMVSGFPFLLRLGIFGLTRLIACFVDVLVVHEDFFKRILVNEYGIDEHKIWVIPHGVEEASEIIDSDRAKEILGVGGKKVLLFFGYIAGYKGIELLIDAFEFLKDDESYILFIAGGEHPRLKDKRKYQEYVRRLKEKARRVSDRIIFTGFVPEERIPIYFSAADLVIFPYKIFMSSSGPLSNAITFRKIILVSDKFASANVIKCLMFKNERDMVEKIRKIFANSGQQNLKNFLTHLRKIKNWRRAAQIHLKLYRQVIH